MTFTLQILLGSVVLGIAAVAHISVLLAGISLLKSIGARLSSWSGTSRWFVILSAAFGVAVLGHTLQAWTWALSFRAVGAMEDLESAIYFALVTATTLGYGDITLDISYRVFGAMAAVSGLLTFGLSTAFIIRTFEGYIAEKHAPEIQK